MLFIMADIFPEQDPIHGAVRAIDHYLRIILTEQGVAILKSDGDEERSANPDALHVNVGTDRLELPRGLATGMSVLALEAFRYLAWLKQTNSPSAAFQLARMLSVMEHRIHVLDLNRCRHFLTRREAGFKREFGDKEKKKSIALAAYSEIRDAKHNDQRSDWEEHAAKAAGVSTRQVRRYLREHREDASACGSVSEPPS
jgi:hypothetical protein